jgi:EH_Signature domain
LFDATAGPDRLASRVLEESDAKTLVACRLDNPSRAKSGYLRAVHFALSAKLPKLLVGDNAPKVLQRAIQFYAPDRTLRFDEKQPNGAMADALVSPWVKPLPSLSDTIRSNVLTHLRQYLGDPRVDARQRWGGASEETRRMVRGWLSKLSLDAFFDIVGQFAGMAGMGHQWKARKAFWNLCLQRGHITDSWLVLGYNVRRSVSDKRELQGSFGNLIDGDPNRSVLLMQIGNLVFSEWTYSGKLRAWNVNARQAPKLFRQEYLREEVTADCLSFPPPRGREGDLEETGTDGVTHTKVWQGRVAALLRQREGIVLQPSDWYVR